MKLKDVLTPEYQRKYDKASRDWDAGRNLREAAAVLFGARSKKAIEAVVKLQEEWIADKRRKGTKVTIAGLGRLTHNGVAYVCKKKTLLYPRARVSLEVDPTLVSDDSLGQLWRNFCHRERSLVSELASALAKYYRQIRQRPRMASIDPLPHLKRNADIWSTLGKPSISFLKRPNGGEVELELAWTPDWEMEHGLYVYLSPDAKVRDVGERR